MIFWGLPSDLPFGVNRYMSWAIMALVHVLGGFSVGFLFFFFKLSSPFESPSKLWALSPLLSFLFFETMKPKKKNLKLPSSFSTENKRNKTNCPFLALLLPSFLFLLKQFLPTPCALVSRLLLSPRGCSFRGCQLGWSSWWGCHLASVHGLSWCSWVRLEGDLTGAGWVDHHSRDSRGAEEWAAAVGCMGL